MDGQRQRLGEKAGRGAVRVQGENWGQIEGENWGQIVTFNNSPESHSSRKLRCVL